MGAFKRVYSFCPRSSIREHRHREALHLYRRLLPLLSSDGSGTRSICPGWYSLTTNSRTKESGSAHWRRRPRQVATHDGPRERRGQDKQKALLAEIISKVNDLFEGELTDDDK
jgi:type I restriction enzyme R subunit